MSNLRRKALGVASIFAVAMALTPAMGIAQNLASKSTDASATSSKDRWLHVRVDNRSEEHTSELQSQSNLVCRLLLEKKTNTMSDSPTMCTINGTTPPIRTPASVTLSAARTLRLLATPYALTTELSRRPQSRP